MPHWKDRHAPRPHDPDRPGTVRTAQLVGWTATGQRVYVCRSRSISARPITAPGEVAPRPTWFSSPVTAGQRPGTSLLMTPATR